MPPEQDMSDLAEWFEKKVVENYALFFSIAQQISGNGHEAEEIVQEAVLKTWRNLGALEDPSALVGWVASATRNAALDRRRKRRPETAESEVLDTSGMSITESRHEDPDERRCILEEIGKLPVNQAVVVTLRFMEGLGLDQIAERLGLSSNNVRVRLHRGLEKLRGSERLRLAAGLAEEGD
jgi:RNA polymerase sigma-70 factor (ECF subfamily)